ncbi:hypothetical protein R75465_07071 [Paraburkholderia aspalathi]|nr:hypothetical protein R75465_07071 [Paraburkholderia aspalathi]
MNSLQSASDQTPLNAARAMNLTATAPIPQSAGPRGSYTDLTPFVVSGNVTRSVRRQATSLTSSEFGTPTTIDRSTVEQYPDNASAEAETVRDRRLRLLVAKFENETTYEDEARLHLLTARLRRLAPRVTVESVNALKAAADTIENASSELEAMKRRLGLA